MKIAIVGSRNFNDYDFLCRKVESYLKEMEIIPTGFVSGGAAGADSLGEEWANARQISITVFKPDWKKFGKAAGMIRNKDIIEAADLVFAFWDGESKGTKNSIDQARKLKKTLMVYLYTASNIDELDF